MRIRIERAEEKDAEEITRIKTRAFNKEINTYLGRDGGPKGYNEVESELMIIKRFIAYKIMLEEKIIGAFFLIPIDDAVMRFEDFVIDPKYQNQGLGYEALELAEKACPYIEKWQLSTPIFSVGNQHLYEKFGYTRVYQNQEEIEYIKITETKFGELTSK